MHHMLRWERRRVCRRWILEFVKLSTSIIIVVQKPDPAITNSSKKDHHHTNPTQTQKNQKREASSCLSRIPRRNRRTIIHPPRSSHQNPLQPPIPRSSQTRLLPSPSGSSTLLAARRLHVLPRRLNRRSLESLLRRDRHDVSGET